MKAAVCYSDGIVKFEEIQEPKTKENEVKVKIKACGICGSDIPRALKSSAHYYPIVLGHEATGECFKLSNWRSRCNFTFNPLYGMWWLQKR